MEHPLAAQDYPSRPVQIIAPSAPGGGFDLVGRILADGLSGQFGRPFVVENRTGGGTLIGTQAAAVAAADGYTLRTEQHRSQSRAPKKSLRYSPGDFTPIGLAVSYSYTLIARPTLAQSTMKDVLEFARRNPGKLPIATGGTGSGQHVGAAILAKTTGVDIVVVPYKGAQQVYPDLISGRVDLFFDNTTTARPYIDGEKVKAIAISSAQRSPLLPNVPTIAESGVAGFEMETWFGLFAPAKTAAPIIDRLRTSLARVGQSEATRTAFERSGGRPLDMSAEQTEGFVRSETTKWADLIRQAGITTD
jgi:tripartite-type tricarboxylate transporter receptor subunit TctC